MGSEMQKLTFYKNVHFYQIENKVISYWSSRLKNTKHLKFCFRQLLYAIRQKRFFHFFRKSSKAYAKNSVCILFYFNMVDLTQQKFTRPFCDGKYFTTAAHFLLQCKTLTINLMAWSMPFLKFQSKNNDFQLK